MEGDIGRLISGLSAAMPVSEAEVRTRLADPLLELLGYPSGNRAEEFPIFANEGGRRLPSKSADVVLFDSTEHPEHRSREGRGWVAEHALLVVELKKPGESLDEARGQAQFYSHWARVPFYALTNGEELAVYRMQGLFHDEEALRCPVAEIPRRWRSLRALLGYGDVRRYCEENRIKSRALPAAGYEDYARALYFELSEELARSMGRTVSEEANRDEAPDGLAPGLFLGAEGSADHAPLPVGLSAAADDGTERSAPYGELLESGSSAVVLSPPGGGKTRLTKMLARDLLLAGQDDPEAPVPVILGAKTWGRRFASVAEGVRQEIDSFAPGAVAGVVEDDLSVGRFVVLVDGLDEAPRGEAGLLAAELLRVAGRTRTRVIATCRDQDYAGELRGLFDEWSIDPLTREQVDGYAATELEGTPGAPTGAQFSYGLGKRLAELVRNPLFLVMTVRVMKTRTEGRMPENRAELYGDYARALLTEWERERMTGRPFEVEPRTKLAVLEAYARATWRGPADGLAFERAVLERKGIWEGERVREELLRSGLLRQEAGGPEFFHPSFGEYFFALDLARRQDDEISRFAQDNGPDDALIEVFVFLVGMLAEERRRALVLDRLEAGNLRAFARCLRARPPSPDPPPDGGGPNASLFPYLRQLRDTHARLVDAHFAEVKGLLPPWSRLPQGAAPEDYDAVIRGYLARDLDGRYSDLRYEVEAIERSQEPALVALSRSEGRAAGRRRLSAPIRRGRGRDSAREAALANLQKEVEELLKKKALPLGDNHPLGVEYVEEELRKLRFACRHGWGVPEDFRHLSLRRSVAEVVRVVDRYMGLRGGPVTFRKRRHPSVGGYIETPVDLPRISGYLRHLEQSGVDPTLFMPPEPDVPDEQVQRTSKGRGSILGDRWYSDEAVALYVGRYYELSQWAYRWIAENHFPALKHQLGFYRAGPVRHRALIYRSRDESLKDSQRDMSWVFVEWEPVEDESEAKTVCRVTHRPPADDEVDFDDNKADRLDRELRDLGRAAESGWPGRWLQSSHPLVHPMGQMAVHDEVYDQLKTDLLRPLMKV